MSREYIKNTNIYDEVLCKEIDSPRLENILTDLTDEEIINLVDAPDKQGWTIIHYAAKYKPELLTKIINLLGPEQAKNKATQRNKLNQTPLFLAAIFGICESIQILIAVLGIEIEDELKKNWHDLYNYDHKIEKELIRAHTPNAIQKILLPKFLRNEKPTEEQKQLCIKYKETLRTTLLSNYASDIKQLEKAIDPTTELGEILWAQRARYRIFRTKTPYNVGKIQKQIDQLIELSIVKPDNSFIEAWESNQEADGLAL